LSSVQGRNQSELDPYGGRPLLVARTLRFGHRTEIIKGKPMLVYDVFLPPNMPVPCNIRVAGALYFEADNVKTQTVLLRSTEDDKKRD
jgi:hypothetical protein